MQVAWARDESGDGGAAPQQGRASQKCRAAIPAGEKPCGGSARGLLVPAGSCYTTKRGRNRGQPRVRSRSCAGAYRSTQRVLAKRRVPVWRSFSTSLSTAIECEASRFSSAIINGTLELIGRHCQACQAHHFRSSTIRASTAFSASPS